MLSLKICINRTLIALLDCISYPLNEGSRLLVDGSNLKRDDKKADNIIMIDKINVANMHELLILFDN